MRKLHVFESITVDGYFTDAHGDMSWAHRGDDAEFSEWVSGNASGGGALLFGRTTYEQMASFWPTPMAAKQIPVVAKQMNALPKYVVSRTLNKVAWQNTQVLNGELVSAVRELKASDGPSITILGSGSIVAQLTEARLIDGYQFVVIPVALGAGRTVFDGAKRPLDLELIGSRAFKNGNVVLTYAARA